MLSPMGSLNPKIFDKEPIAMGVAGETCNSVPTFIVEIDTQISNGSVLYFGEVVIQKPLINHLLVLFLNVVGDGNFHILVSLSTDDSIPQMNPTLGGS